MAEADIQNIGEIYISSALRIWFFRVASVFAEKLWKDDPPPTLYAPTPAVNVLHAINNVVLQGCSPIGRGNSVMPVYRRLGTRCLSPLLFKCAVMAWRPLWIFPNALCVCEPAAFSIQSAVALFPQHLLTPAIIMLMLIVLLHKLMYAHLDYVALLTQTQLLNNNWPARPAAPSSSPCWPRGCPGVSRSTPRPHLSFSKLHAQPRWPEERGIEWKGLVQVLIARCVSVSYHDIILRIVLLFFLSAGCLNGYKAAL